MVTLNKIYTKTGDKGLTDLGNGSRTKKSSDRVIAYGTVDELNANIGLARIESSKELSETLQSIQNDLFDLGADLCKPETDTPGNEGTTSLRITEFQVKQLEKDIDLMNKDLEPLKSFVLPGGTRSSAQLHICRTICRRAERYAVKLAEAEKINANLLKYLNRLSDWFFVAARHENKANKADVLWVPGITHKSGQ